jgi:hypothetical protein
MENCSWYDLTKSPAVCGKSGVFIAAAYFDCIRNFEISPKTKRRGL